MAQKKFTCPACGAPAEWNPGSQVHDYPNGIASSGPGLPRLRGYPGKPFPIGRQPRRGCISGEPNASTPFGLVNLSYELPTVARSSQPWFSGASSIGIPDPILRSDATLTELRITGLRPRVASQARQPWAGRSNPFGIHSDDDATKSRENGVTDPRYVGIYPDGQATNPNGIGIIQPSVDAQRLRWVIAQTTHQL